MSLHKQMILFIASLLLVVLLGTFSLNLSNTKKFLQNQLSAHAQDTATSLGLSLSSIEDPSDLSSMETMINAVFDRGYYASIHLTDMENTPLYTKDNPQVIAGVPHWFTEQITLTAPPAEALVQSGWIPVGTLTVVSHTGYAYAELWQSVINLLLWFILSAVIAIFLVIYALKLMLNPLKQMESQAQAIVKKEYLYQDPLPSTVEFRQVVIAMNAMVMKLKTIFERDANTAAKLQKMAYQDSVTGLSNRRHFEMTVDSLLDPNEETTAGTICLVRVNKLKELNDQYGYLMGDKLIKKLAESITSNLWESNGLIARLNGTEIIAVLPNTTPCQVQSRVEMITHSLPDILKRLTRETLPTNISIAYMHYRPGQSRGAILANLDFAVEQASRRGENGSFFYDNGEEFKLPSSHSWEQTLSDAFAEQRFLLFQQSAYNLEREVHDQEVFVRLKEHDGTVRSAGYFMPAIEQLGKSAEIDRLVITLALQHLQSDAAAPVIAINLSNSVLEDETFKAALMDTLLESTPYPEKISFEMTERLVAEEKSLSWPLIQELKARKIKFGIDHFGSRLTNMHYLQDLRPDYVKLDAAFSKAIEHDEQTRNYVSSLCELAKSLDIKIIAMSVENESQQNAFAELGIDYFQGFLYGAPSPLDPLALQKKTL